MKLSKPFVNLTKSKSTGEYTLNSVVSLPKDYALNSIEQGPIEQNREKIWAVTVYFTTNGSLETDIVEFAVPLKQEPTKEIKKVSMIVKESPKKEALHKEDLHSKSSSRHHNRDKGTAINYDDAEVDV